MYYKPTQGYRRQNKQSLEYTWITLIQQDYSELFDVSFKMHVHYLVTVQRSLGNNEDFHWGFYLDSGIKPIVFDSGCTIAITPFQDTFLKKIKLVKKTITGLSSTATVEGESTIE